MNGLSLLDVIGILLCPFLILYCLYYLDQWLYRKKEK
jgi:hypothetical protein